MKKLTPKTERKLMDCINQTSDNVNNGLCPNDAIVKAAQATGVAPGEVKLVVHAYNTGQTSRQRTEGEGAFEKSAEFELADLAAVLDLMYPDNVKTAAAISTEVSPEYSFSPRPMLDRLGSREKRSGVEDWGTLAGQPITKPDAYPQDPATAIRKAASDVDRLNRDVAEARRKQASAFDDMSGTFVGLTDYFRRPDAKPIPVVKEAVMLLHGDYGEHIMDEIVKVTPSLSKLANHRIGKSLLGTTGRAKFAAVTELDATEEPFPQIALLLSQAATYNELKHQWQEKHADAEKQAGVLLRPFVRTAVSPSVLELSSTDMMDKVSAGPLGLMGSMALIKGLAGDTVKGLKGPEEDKMVQRTLDQLSDPGHEDQLRRINSQAMLQDMILNDPVISGYEPEEVSTAYNNIVQLTPSAADKRLTIQALLRKQLQQGQFDQFEVDQLVDMEGKMRQQARPQPQINGVSPDGSVI